MKSKLVALLGFFALFLAPAILRAQADDTHTERSSARQYAERILNPGSLAKSGAAAGLDQALTNPYEWGGGVAGFARRLGSALGTHVVRSSIHFGVSKLLHEELDYRASGKKGFGPRLKYALISTVLTRKTTTQHRTVAIGEISGIVGGGFISRLWHPTSYHTVASGFAATGVGLAAEAGTNVLHEFWPEIRHPHRHAEQAGDATRDKLERSVDKTEANEAASPSLASPNAETQIDVCPN